jgi:uncharacterized protein (TIGR02597 family)
MRPFHSLLAATLVSLCLTAALPAQTVQTIPVGFNTATVTAAPNASTPSSTVVSVPFYQIASFQGAISTVDSSNQISFSGTTFTSTLTAPPYLARLKTGTSVGRFFLVTSFTNTQLTLDTATAGYTLTTGSPSTTQAQVAVGDSVEILPANTLGTLFPSGAPFQTGPSSSQADNVYIWNGTTWDVFFHNGTNWKKTANFGNFETKPVLPDQGLFIVRRGTSPLNLTFLGTVSSTTERTDFPGAGSSFKSNRFPVDATLAGSATSTTYPLNLQSLPNWQSGASAAAADNVYIWNGTTWDVFFYNGTNWKKTANFGTFDNQKVLLGSAMFIVRRSTAAGSNSTLVQTLPYTL